jgi:hypothetical protein
LKQYSGDVFSTCLVLLAVWGYLLHGDRRRYSELLLVFGAMLWVSYTTIMFVPLALYAVVFGKVIAHRRTVAARCAGVLTIALLAGGANYIFFVQPNSTAALKAFWASGFPGSARGIETVHFYIEHFAAMPFSFFFPSTSLLKDAAKAAVEALSSPVKLAAGVTVMALTVVVAKFLVRTRTHMYAALFFLIPAITLAVVNRMGVYPVSSRRLTLFMAPCGAILIAAALEAIWQQMLQPLLTPRFRSPIRMLVRTACLIGIAVPIVHATNWDTDWNEDDGMETAVRFLKSAVRMDRDVVYVHAWEEEPVRLYLQTLDWKNAPVRYGHAGYPCCRRAPAGLPTDLAGQRTYLLYDFNEVIPRPEGRLWLVFPAAGRYPGAAIPDPARIIINNLYDTGCRAEARKSFGWKVVYELQCDVRPSQLLPVREPD